MFKILWNSDSAQIYLGMFSILQYSSTLTYHLLGFSTAPVLPLPYPHVNQRSTSASHTVCVASLYTFCFFVFCELSAVHLFFVSP